MEDILKVALTALFSVAALFILTKLMGHKQVAQLDFFDYLSGITVGSIAAELATELENPIRPLVALVVYTVVSVALSFIMNKLPRSRKFINGAPCILLDNGRLYRKNFKKSKLDLSEFMVMCREQGYFELNDIQTAVLEYNGKLSVLAKSEKRPANPEDLSLSPKPAHICTEIILDGRIIEGNIKRLGYDLTWLDKELKKQKINRADEVFLAVCDNDGKVTFFKNGE